MDYFHIASQVFAALWWLILLGLLVNFFRSPWFKGFFGEGMVKLLAKWRLDDSVYCPLHNVTLPTPGGTTQIDHIFVSPYGVFVVETKNFKGWIFGSERQAIWTQKIYKRAYEFQNPLRQNYKHIKALKAILGISPKYIYSVIVFVGNSTFKTRMPPNVTYVSGYIRYIKSKTQVVLSPLEVESIIHAIQSARLAPSRIVHRDHVRSVKSRTDPFASRFCPKCGSQMVLRTTRKGQRAGSRFWGCSQFPKCWMVQNVI